MYACMGGCALGVAAGSAWPALPCMRGGARRGWMYNCMCQRRAQRCSLATRVHAHGLRTDDALERWQRRALLAMLSWRPRRGAQMVMVTHTGMALHTGGPRLLPLWLAGRRCRPMHRSIAHRMKATALWVRESESDAAGGSLCRLPRGWAEPAPSVLSWLSRDGRVCLRMDRFCKLSGGVSTRVLVLCGDGCEWDRVTAVLCTAAVCAVTVSP